MMNYGRRENNINMGRNAEVKELEEMSGGVHRVVRIISRMRGQGTCFQRVRKERSK